MRMKQVYAAYAEWCRQNGFHQVNSIVVKKLMGETWGGGEGEAGRKREPYDALVEL